MSKLPRYLSELRKSKRLSAKKISEMIDDTLSIPRSRTTINDYIRQFENGFRALDDVIKEKQPAQDIFFAYCLAMNFSDLERKKLYSLLVFNGFKSVYSEEPKVLSPGQMLDTLPESKQKEILVNKIQKLYDKYKKMI